MTEVKFYESIEDELLKFAVIISKAQGQYVFCRHKDRDTWEIPGGHREPLENIILSPKYTNTISKINVAVHRNVFALIVEIDDYEGETHLQTKRATYKEIRAWVKKHYGLHVSNLAIS